MLHLRVLIVAVLIATLSGAVPLLAATAGPVSGRAVDAGGRPLAGVRIELVRATGSRSAGLPAQVQQTDARGTWSFRSVPAGEYVVRMSHDDRTTGVPVAVVDNTGVPGVVIVAPSLSLLERPPQVTAGAGTAAAASANDAGLTTALILLAGSTATLMVVSRVVRDES